MSDHIVNSLDEAHVGSFVWRYHSEQNRYEDGRYVGRGAWVVETVTAETRASFEIGGTKFERKTGAGRPYRGYSTRDLIAGHRERELYDFGQARWKIADMVKAADIETLRRIADLVGWKP